LTDDMGAGSVSGLDNGFSSVSRRMSPMASSIESCESSVISANPDPEGGFVVKTRSLAR